MTGTQQVWLTKDGYERLTEELRRLIKERSEDAPLDGSSTDEDVLAARQEREARIRKLQELLQDPIVGEAPADDGVAEPGMIVTVSYADGDEETFLLAERVPDAYPDMELCSPRSPLGKAILGAKEGEQREYRMPDGRSMSVTVKRAVPYGGPQAA
ncbi:GreA/GreB family elongation factor [Pseudonocardia thermophila]|jgi:Transcription elongation factor|uniref:GreA/GreB family elongation factor n=1 Tax=Pseudonocardia thermophila TaxID=1848 RepID=A0A1M6Y295_PSETH|nr:GreA/GreB family elongation factor [Pseudonocardia thermophila]SHL12372.1 GreA/GreB family elongation factor [Pseudonocardia thermophila]